MFLHTRINLFFAILISMFVGSLAQAQSNYSGSLISEVIGKIKTYQGVSDQVEFNYVNGDNGEVLSLSMEQVAQRLQEDCFSPQSKRTLKRNYLSGDHNFVEFSCTQDAESFNHIVHVFATSDRNSNLVDLQILNAQQKEDRMGELVKASISLSMGALVSGLLVARIYPGQRDKIEHSIAGSLIATATILVAHYGFKLDENKSMWLGIGAALVAGCLKEQMDKRHPQKHTVDSRDIKATFVGGVFPAVAFRLQFSFKSISGM